MAVEVYVWLPGMSKSKVSHAAIMVESGGSREYLSAYPVNEGLTGVGRALLYGSAEFRTRESDLAEEGEPLIVRFTKLDDANVRAKMTALKNAGNYGFIIQNCSTQAGLCLESGIPSNLVNWGPAQAAGAFRTPMSLLAYAKGLQLLYG